MEGCAGAGELWVAFQEITIAYNFNRREKEEKSKRRGKTILWHHNSSVYKRLLN